MSKRYFVIILAAFCLFLVGWIYYISNQAKTTASIEEISVDWWGSGHADVSAEAFVHWSEDEPAEIPERCAKCHSGPSFLDFLGQDGSEEFVVDAPGPVEQVITCEVCHNEKAHDLERVTFPSGEELSLGAGNAVCGSCHSGMTAGTRVASTIADFDDDELVPDASFINPHYYYAAATAYGSEAKGGYEYTGKSYVGKFYHADGVQTCTECHDPHSLHMRKDYEGENATLCSACHSNVTGYKDYREVFVDGVDYDADGNVEGLYHEIQGLQSVLYNAIQLYAEEVIGTPIIWANQYPYLFKDTNGNGEADEDETIFPNAYSSFTSRLLRTGFNFQYSVKEPGAYVHNGKYMLQLLYDSIEDLAEVVDVPMDDLIRALE